VLGNRERKRWRLKNRKNGGSLDNALENRESVGTLMLENREKGDAREKGSLC
jgi:hypothetical protein